MQQSNSTFLQIFISQALCFLILIFFRHKQPGHPHHITKENTKLLAALGLVSFSCFLSSSHWGVYTVVQPTIKPITSIWPYYLCCRALKVRGQVQNSKQSKQNTSWKRKHCLKKICVPERPMEWLWNNSESLTTPKMQTPAKNINGE